MALPTTNITTALAKSAISASTNAVKQLCISTNINEWALHKPANYGAGNDAWTVAAGEVSGYVRPTGVSSDTTGHRLGDFRGYNHTAREPRYFTSNYSASYPKYKPVPPILVAIYNTLSEMHPTLDADGFSPDYIIQKEGADWLIAMKFYLNGVAQSTLTQPWLTGTISQNLLPAKGTYTLSAKYWTRATTAHAWVERVDIEGSSVSLTMTETAPEFHISTISSPDDPIEFFSGSNNYTVATFDIVFTVINDVANTLNYTFFWEIGNKSGTIAINNTASASKTYTAAVVDCTVYTPSELFQMRINNSVGEIIFNSAYNITVTNLA